MICVFCSKHIPEAEEPTVIKHMAIAIPFGPAKITGLDITDTLICGECSDALLKGLKDTRVEAASIRGKMRERAREPANYGDQY